jgi:hypothetical protein
MASSVKVVGSKSNLLVVLKNSILHIIAFYRIKKPWIMLPLRTQNWIHH